MIYDICLNPAIDRNYYINDFVHGNQYKGLMPRVCAGGKGINVAKVCTFLGQPVKLYGFIGQNNSNLILDDLSAIGISYEMIPVSGFTRSTNNIIDNQAHTETELLEVGPHIPPEACEHLLRQLSLQLTSDDLVVCSGLSAPGVPKDFYIRLSIICKQSGALCILDTNGQNLRDSIEGHYFLIKPNQQELCELCNVKATYDTDVLRQLAEELLTHTEWVLVSMGSHGGLLVGQKDCWFAHAPSVKVQSTIGCGDSLVAGFAIAIQSGEAPENALRFAMACGSANAMTDDPGCMEKKDVKSLLQKVDIIRQR